MLFRQLFGQRPHPGADVFGRKDFHLAAKARHPAVERLADTDGHIKVEALVLLRQEGRRSAEPLPHGAFEVGCAAQGHAPFGAAVHAEVLAQVGGQIEISKLFPAAAGPLQHPDAGHPVHPVVADAHRLLFVLIGDEVIAAVLPRHLPRADDPLFGPAHFL